MEPPHVIFLHPIPYHPNIDGEGRICLDILRGPPNGAWKPTITLLTLCNAIRLLLSEPNASDPLCTEAAADYQYDYAAYCRKAKAKAKQLLNTITLEEIDKENINETVSTSLSLSKRHTVPSTSKLPEVEEKTEEIPTNNKHPSNSLIDSDSEDVGLKLSLKKKRK